MTHTFRNTSDPLPSAPDLALQQPVPVTSRDQPEQEFPPKNRTSTQ
jgi:hypothetical protein